MKHSWIIGLLVLGCSDYEETLECKWTCVAPNIAQTAEVCSELGSDGLTITPICGEVLHGKATFGEIVTVVCFDASTKDDNDVKIESIVIRLDDDKIFLSTPMQNGCWGAGIFGEGKMLYGLVQREDPNTGLMIGWTL